MNRHPAPPKSGSLLPGNVRIREYGDADRAMLGALWSSVFGDPPVLMADFLRLLPEMGSCCVAVQDGIVLGAASLLDGYTLVSPDSGPLRCGYLYAVAVAEAARGLGLGSAVGRGAAELGRQRGADLLCTLPAEASLYRWYGRILSLTHCSMRRIRCCSRLPDAEQLSASEYLTRREALLRHTAHVVPNAAAMEYQRLLCEAYGGGLYSSGSSIFCAYREKDGWLVREVLPEPPALFADAPPDGPVPYVCADRPLPDGLVWNLTLD